MLLVAALAATFIGLAVGLLGGGGSILTTPLLIYVMGFEPKTAIIASLVVVAATSAAALIPYARSGSVRWRTGLIFGGAGMIGAFAGGQLGSRMPGSLLLAAFAVMMAATAVAMLRGRREIPMPSNSNRSVVRIIADGLVVGLITGLVGAGGGFLVVPALILLGGLQIHVAIGTSLLVVTMKSIAGFLGYAISFGGPGVVSINPQANFSWTVVLVVTALAVLGSLGGAALSGRIHPDRLRITFAASVLAMAAFVLVQQVGRSVLDFARGSPLQAAETALGAIAIIGVLILIIRWPAKVPVADFESARREDAGQGT